jgi:HprK-related kinase B
MTRSESESIAELARALKEEYPTTAALGLQLGSVAVRVCSNSSTLLARLAEYFGALVVASVPGSAIEITALQAPPPEFRPRFTDWPRPLGKGRPKEAFADVPDGRIVRKLRTGMHFLVGAAELLAVGACVEHMNQVVNFIVAQYIATQRRTGWVVCHAAAVADSAGALAIAAAAGAGKSTLGLHLMSSGLSYVSGDRLLLRQTLSGAEVAGVPKRPRVNPGTLLSNPDLASILPQQRQRELLELEPMQLWQLEEKYDVNVEGVYGPGRSCDRAPLTALLILNWEPTATLPTRFTHVDLEQRRDLLNLLIKPPGVFDAAMPHAGAPAAGCDASVYIAALSQVRVVEAAGKTDFRRAVEYCRQLLELQSS